MSSVTVCVRFRPLNSRERKMRGDRVCILAPDAESFVFKDEKEDLVFGFDRVFYQDSAQIEVYEFLALPIVQDAVNGINGTIITYGQVVTVRTVWLKEHTTTDAGRHPDSTQRQESGVRMLQGLKRWASGLTSRCYMD